VKVGYMVGIAQPVQQRATGLTALKFSGISSFSFVLFSCVLLMYFFFLHFVLMLRILYSVLLTVLYCSLFMQHCLTIAGGNKYYHNSSLFSSANSCFYLLRS
jgi:hypothetical protein